MRSGMPSVRLPWPSGPGSSAQRHSQPTILVADAGECLLGRDAEDLQRSGGPSLRRLTAGENRLLQLRSQLRGEVGHAPHSRAARFWAVE